MGRETPRPSAARDDYATQLRRAREPFLSLVEALGFSDAVATLLRSSRRFLEENPDEFGPILARGTRDEGALWYAAEAAEFARRDMGYDVRTIPGPDAAVIPARIFSIIAYRHPFFDGNKRTAFISASILGLSMGYRIRSVPYAELEEEVRELTAREAAEGEVSAWFLTNVFIVEEAGGS